jgi:hypothetical protein
MNKPTHWIIAVLAIVVVGLLGWNLFGSKESVDQPPLRTSSPPTPNIHKEPTEADAQNEIYELWKYAKQISPLDLSSPAVTGSKKTQLVEELKTRSFMAYLPRHRHAFRAFRDGVVDCATKEDRPECMVELMGKLNVLLADWKLDKAAAARMNDSHFSDYINRHEVFMKRMALVNVETKSRSKIDPSGSALVYVELYYLADRLLSLNEVVNDSDPEAKAKYYMTHATRAGLLGVDTSICEMPSDQNAMDKLRSELIEVSSHFGEGNWDELRSKIMGPLIIAWKDSSITEADYHGTRYESIVGAISKMRELVGSR